LKIKISTLVLMILISLSGCGPKKMMIFEHQQISDTFELQHLAVLISKAGTKRGWGSTLIKPGHIVSRLDVKNKYMVEVDIYYTNKEYSIVYRDSKNLKFNGKSIHRSYNTWVNYLNKDIGATLKHDSFVRSSSKMYTETITEDKQK
jgi:hypothetical protein